MENQIDDKVKHARFQKLSDLLNDISLGKNEKLLGETFEVLVEEVSKNNPESINRKD